ncbi:protein DpdJ [Paraburkholderia diazotrophica]|uniref:Helicase conserved C-terminal domain-containing protein n=1 Tax=Paraburkholderia diazotrophica TaxID=667676 RepID=A0A1H6R8C9_9BURK|nr:protein DpdJ [Paraburkholderia diazotrophica]SEI52081.1 Helicase conserved C-terminal domain-containing protein [Paraburkholderia diazotrophica]
MTISLPDLRRCLDKFEEIESTLLTWGDTGGMFSEAEVKAVLVAEMPENDPLDVLIELERHAMLVESPHPEGLEKMYRTRMGEAAHLYRSSRQWFLNKPIDQSKTLVSDFRFIRRTRGYPRRDRDANQFVARVLENAPSAEVNSRKETMRALLDDEGAPFSLSGFQERATGRILKAWDHHRRGAAQPTGTIVCAGTGSGKTLAFYLPAITALSAEVSVDDRRRVRILAVYPRRELLKDQFMETWAQCRKLDSVTHLHGRKIRIAALFGDTPKDVAKAYASAAEKRGNLSFDLMRCPTKGCDGKMEWRFEALKSGIEKLQCNKCSHSVTSDEVALTRESQAKLPPDILFTTTEMLNEHLSNFRLNHLFGVGQHAGPNLVLLDEVHTYGGSSGAQSAFLLRRWMKRSNCRPHFVGLSATLADATSFFSELIGAKAEHVELVEPLKEELEDSGAEYLMVLRGDPVSQTALLSTTIQASMLTRRVLDNHDRRSEGTWGTKAFIFTDDLDVNNRLYHQLADAEGWQTSFRGLTPTKPTLASLRGLQIGLDRTGRLKRVRFGQDWRVGLSIGHSMRADDRAKVGRTSSQDAGVDSSAELIVATSSLEVGFNDPSVGAVLQHKAPRDMASYLQRKGRAGRSRSMRPWMIVVLSDYGRDRVAFQRYEDLLDPVIKGSRLPLSNIHIQKMQGAMAALDWISLQLGHGSLVSILKYPKKREADLAKIQSLIEKVFVPGDVQDQMVKYIKDALRVDEAAMQKILWASPRSLMLEFLPSLRRQISTSWAEYGTLWKGLPHGRSPSPEFIPDALFAALNVPSLFVSLERGSKSVPVWEGLAFFQGLREFAPGRISKRFATDSNLDTDWLVPPAFAPTPNVEEFVDFEIADAFGESIVEEAEVETGACANIRVLRPMEIHTRKLDRRLQLSEKSHAQTLWGVQFAVPDATPVYPSPSGSWENSLADVTFCMHQHMTQLEVVRYSLGATASLRFKDGSEAQTTFEWKRNGTPVAIGARQWVDGARFRFRLQNETIARGLEDECVLRALRPVLFRQQLLSLDHFRRDPFLADWVSECFMAALLSEVFDLAGSELTNSPTLREAIQRLRQPDGIERLRAIPGSLFQPDDADHNAIEQELQAALREILSNDHFLDALFGCSDLLWREGAEIGTLVATAREILANTLAATVQQALCILLPDVDERSLLADVVWKEECLEVFLSEIEPGGAGIIGRLSEQYFDDPMRVLNVITRVLQPSDYEQIDYDLYDLLSRSNSKPEIRASLASLRSSLDMKHRREANERFRKIVGDEGFALSHSFLSVLHSRILRPGSSAETDKNILSLLHKWRTIEATSRIEWPLNVAAHALARAQLGPDVQTAQLFRTYCNFQGLLWPRGHTVRQSALNYYSPFSRSPLRTERLLAAKLFEDHAPRVEFSENYLRELHAALTNAGRAELVVSRSQQGQILRTLGEIQVKPVDHLGLLLYPRIAGLRRELGAVVLRIELGEALQ